MRSTSLRARDIYLLFTLILVISLSATALATEPYPLGVALGLSGTGAPYCKDAVEGIEIAVNEINTDGGLLGQHPINIYIRDTATHPDTAKKVAHALIQKSKVKAIVGTYSSATSLAIKPICRDNRVLHIAPISNSENITKIDHSSYTFSVVPNTYMMSKTVVMGIAKLAKSKGWKRYATIASDYAWGRSSQEIMVDLLRREAPEIQLVSTYWPRLGQTRFNSFIVDMLSQKPDFVLGSIAGADNAFWMRDCRDYRMFKKIAYPGGLVSVFELINDARSIRRGLYGRTRAPFFAHMNNPRMAAFVKSFQAKFDRFPSDWAVLLYDAVYILKQGVEAAGSIETDQVIASMKGMNVDTTRGRFYFRDIDNQLSCSAYFGRVADDPQYSIPIYHDMMEFKGPDIWRPEAEIKAARK